MPESKLLTSFQLADGKVVRKFESPNGDVTYRYASGQGNVSGQFISPQVGDSLQERAAENTGESRNVNFIVRPQTKGEKQEAIEKRYPKFNNTKGLDAGRIKGNESKLDRNTKGWMKNETIQMQVENDALIDSRDKERAIEARARQIAEDMNNVRSEREAIQVLKAYGFDY